MADEKDTAKEPSMIVKYWGVRGSIPAPMASVEIRAKQVGLLKALFERGKLNSNMSYEQLLDPDFVKTLFEGLPLSVSGTYGGNTTCVEVQCKDSPLAIVDGGTGMRALGSAIAGKIFGKVNINPLDSTKYARDPSEDGPKEECHIFFTHYHWDHIQGIPFFAPLFFAQEISPRFEIYGKMNVKQSIEEVLRGQQQFPNFPVVWEELDCDIGEPHNLKRLHPKPIKLGKSVVRYGELDHPDSALGYRFEVKVSDTKSIVYAHISDTEGRPILLPNVLKLARNADVMYHDTQYSPEDYAGIDGSVTGKFPKVGWGHSTYDAAIMVALEAGVKVLVFGHFDPARTDALNDQFFDAAQRFRDTMVADGKYKGRSLEVMMAYEGLEHRLT